MNKMQDKAKKNNFLVYEIVAVAVVVVIAVFIIQTLVPSSPSAALLKFVHTVPSGVTVYSANNSIVITGSNLSNAADGEEGTNVQIINTAITTIKATATIS